MTWVGVGAIRYNYVVIYRTEEADSEARVIIVAAIHGARDIRRILGL